MDKLIEFVEMLNDDKITAKMYDYFISYQFEFNPKWRNHNRFVSYLKAYYVDRYNTVPEDLKNSLFDDLKRGELNYGVFESFVDIINGSEAKQDECIGGATIIDFKELLNYKEDDIYKDLSADNNWVIDIILEKTGIIPLNELKKGDYLTMDGYKLSNDEIKTIEYAKLVRGYIDIIHSLYDEYDGSFEERTICNYNAIEDDVLKSLAFHTDKKNPEYEILFPDGTIVNYYMGDIRILPMNFKQLVKYVKLTFIDNYYNGEDNDFYQMLIEPLDIDFEVPFSEMDEDTLEALIKVAAEMAYSSVYDLSQKYSKRMIEKSKKDVEKMKKLVRKYKL